LTPAICAGKVRVNGGKQVGGGAPDDLVGPDAEDLRRGPVHRRQSAFAVDGYDAVAEALEHALEIGLHLADVLEQGGLLDGDARLGGEGGQQPLVVGREHARMLVHHLSHADDRSFLVADRHAEDRAGAEPRALIELGVEQRVAVRIGDVEGLARRRHAPCDAGADGEADLAPLEALGHLAPQLPLRAVEQEQRAALGGHDLARLLEDDLDQVGELQRAGERVRHVEQGGDLLPAGNDLLVEDGVPERERDDAAERVHGVHVAFVEGAVLAVHRAHHADDLAAVVAQRRAEHGAGVVPGLLVDLGVEGRMLVGVGDPHRLASGGDVAGDATGDREAELLRLHALRQLAPQLAAHAVDEEQRGAVGLQALGQRLQDLLDDAREVEVTAERRRHLEPCLLVAVGAQEPGEERFGFAGSRRLSREGLSVPAMVTSTWPLG
jgi:hypothetical protein